MVRAFASACKAFARTARDVRRVPKGRIESAISSAMMR
jgi:hypothetical protein